ncbi:MAG: glycosyltransferase family 39 protein [Thermoanaerobaculia bacterium]
MATRLKPARYSRSAAVRAPRSSGVDWFDAAALALLAFLLRALFVLSGDDRSWPYTVFYEGDSEAYFRFARALLAGELYDNGIPFHPPGFAFLLAGLHALFGAAAARAVVPHLAVKLVLGALVGGGGVAALYLATSRAVGRAAATLAALLASAHFGLYVLSVAPVADGLFQLLLLVALALFVCRLDFGRTLRRGPAIALGLVLGGLALTRAEGLLVGALFVAWGAVATAGAARGARRERLRAAAPWAAVGFLALAVVAPWTVRNSIRLGEIETRFAGRLAEPLPRFVPVSIYGPLNLALANHDAADGAFSRDALAERSQIPQLDLTVPEHLRFILHGDRIAFDWMAAHPGRFARLVWRKWALYFGALRLGFTQWDLPGGRIGLRRPVDAFVPDSPLAAFLLAPLLLGGAIRLARGSGDGRRWLALVAAITAISMGVVALFFGYARLALVVLPLWLSLVAVALVGVAAFVRSRFARGGSGDPVDARRLRALAILAALALVAIEGLGAWRGHRLEATGTTLGTRSTLDRDQPVRFRPLPPP